MGQSTYNLSEFFNRLGIKNPRPTMLESVQPVVVAGELSRLAPQLVPPTDIWHIDRNAAAGSFSQAQFCSRGAGGALIHSFHAGGSIAEFALVDAPQALLVTIAGSGPYSAEAPASIVQVGLDLVNPIAAFAASFPNQNTPMFTGPGQSLFIPAGKIFLISTKGMNQGLTNGYIFASDIPASEHD